MKVARKMEGRNLLGKSLGRERVRCCNIWAGKRLGWKCHAPLGVPVAEKDISALVKPIRPGRLSRGRAGLPRLAVAETVAGRLPSRRRVDR